jgi:hypothetical protein
VPGAGRSQDRDTVLVVEPDAFLAVSVALDPLLAQTSVLPVLATATAPPPVSRVTDVAPLVCQVSWKA